MHVKTARFLDGVMDGCQPVHVLFRSKALHLEVDHFQEENHRADILKSGQGKVLPLIDDPKTGRFDLPPHVR